MTTPNSESGTDTPSCDDLPQDAAVRSHAPNAEGASRRPVLRAEFIIATLALVTSACASVAAIVQTRESAVQSRATIEQTQLVAKQLGASLWPYLTVDDTYSPTQLSVRVTNEGLGPALIRTFTVSIDRQPRTRLRDIIDLVDPNRRTRHVSESDLGAGKVIRPADSITSFAISDPQFRETRAQTAMRRARFEICYCSLLKECWSLSSDDSEPTPVHTCKNRTHELSL